MRQRGGGGRGKGSVMRRREGEEIDLRKISTD